MNSNSELKQSSGAEEAPAAASKNNHNSIEGDEVNANQTKPHGDKIIVDVITEKNVTEPISPTKYKVDFWSQPVTINPNNFKYKSLSSWGLNIAMGCNHGCRFCYVPQTSANKQENQLLEYGVTDPDAQWGEYVLLRPWDGKKFHASLMAAQNTPNDKLAVDGNRAVMLCTTTDPYQILRGRNADDTKKLNVARRRLVHNSLRRIRDYSTLNVRILTRSPLAGEDFALFKTFENRLVFGMSLPTLDNDLARIYEPNAPAPSQRLKTLRKAKEAGLHVYVALAPTYPECGEADIRATIRAVKELDPITIYHEPINVRAENVKRIEAHAKSIGRTLKTEVFATTDSWRRYALEQLGLVQRIAEEEGVADRLHLWPDKDLKSESGFAKMRKAEFEAQLGRAMTVEESRRFKAQVAVEFEDLTRWINGWHNRVSEWPGVKKADWQRPDRPGCIRVQAQADVVH